MTAIHYAQSTGGFYLSAIHGDAIPGDAVEISAEDHAALIEGQSAGMMIVAGPDGAPTLQPRPGPSPAEALAAERAWMRCSRFQARAALHIAGLLPQVEAAVAAADPLVQIAWADATEFQRASPTIAALAVAVGLTDTQVDDLFRAAMQITA